ncbi:MAG: glycoside hydrolase family 99-like domain-containing protein [Vicinamibacterales bacterium]
MSSNDDRSTAPQSAEDRSALPFTGERYVPDVGGNIRLEHLHRYVLAREYCRGHRVLDIASGEGYGSAMLADVAARVTGVDISPEAVSHAREAYTQANLEFLVGECAAIPLPDASVDVVVSFETLEHHGQHDLMMREVRRVLAPGGTLVISTPDKREYSDKPSYANPYHVRELYREEFERLLKGYFAHVKVLGQRIAGGSLLWPVNGPPEGFDGREQQDGQEISLQPPLYVIGVASDQPVARPGVAFLSGGPFVWFDEFENLRTHALRIEAALEQSRAEAVALREQMDYAREVAIEERAKRERLTAVYEQRRIEVAGLQSDRRQLEARLREIETSLSWRVTAPLRVARRIVASGQPAWRIVRDLGMATYRSLPISIETRVRMKSRLFQTVPFLFRRTAMYRAWEASQRTVRPSGTGLSKPTGDLPAWFYTESTQDYVPITPTPGVDTRIRAIAFYLPQFHPIAENDRWWGKGFTEWTNVTRGKPQFVGHYQPHLPGELGFYDLRNPDVQRRQIELARMYGIYGFCYHHYWFAGTRLLGRPLEQMLADTTMDFPFCLCWANENWTRRWDGKDQEVLIAQHHSPEDDLAFIRDIEPALRDPRYIRVNGRPLLIVYRPSLLPDARATAERWRTYCREAGIGDLYLVSTMAFERTDPTEFGFDAATEFSPNNLGVPALAHDVVPLNPDFQGTVYDYQYLVDYSRTFQPPDYTLFRSATPMWDNEARRPGRGTAFAHASPALYRETLENACHYADEHPGPDQPFVFINAWNEWAEGAHLEPDRRYGYAFLQATADALRRFPASARQPIVCVSHDAHPHGAQMLTLNLARTINTVLGRDVEVLLCGDGPLKPEYERAARVHDFRPAQSRAARERIARELYERGARVALCNTSAVGEAVDILKQTGFTVVSMVHELPDLIRRHQLEASAALVAERADHVIFAAEVVRDRFLALTGMRPDKAIVRPQGLYIINKYKTRLGDARQGLRRQLGLPDATLLVLGAGYADHRKGIDLFVEVGVRLSARCPEARMVWIGHHEPTAFEAATARIADAGLDARFIFPGLTEPDIYFAGADLFLLTSREDPFPAVVLEALDVEVPVIAFEGGGGAGELLHRDCGVLVPYLDVDAMATAALTLLENPAERTRLARTGQAIVAREFDFADYARFLINLGLPKRPSISVVVPNYNYARYLERRLQSILEQTRQPDEILVLDDASSDDSVAIAERVLGRGGIPYRIVQNVSNAGCYRQWLRGWREATGDLIWIAEADDDCAPTLLETLTCAFDDPAVVLAYCQSTQIGGDGRQIAPDYLAWTADIDPDRWRHPYVRDGRDEIRDTLVVKNTIPNVSGVLMRRRDLSGIADALVTLKNAGDWLVYLHLLESGSIAFVPAALNHHRRHGGSVTIGLGGLNLMRESLLVQRHALDRHSISLAVDERRERAMQAIYEYLGLNLEGPSSYKDHPALKDLVPAVTR